MPVVLHSRSVPEGRIVFLRPRRSTRDIADALRDFVAGEIVHAEAGDLPRGAVTEQLRKGALRLGKHVQFLPQPGSGIAFQLVDRRRAANTACRPWLLEPSPARAVSDPPSVLTSERTSPILPETAA